MVYRRSLPCIVLVQVHELHPACPMTVLCAVTVSVGKMTIDGCKVILWDVGGQVRRFGLTLACLHWVVRVCVVVYTE
jgi:hypothetical protein